MRWPARPTLHANTLLVIVAGFLTAADNGRFWRIVITTLPHARAPALAQGLAIAAVLTALTVLVLLPLSNRRLVRPGAAVALILGALAAHFTDRFGTVIDRHAVASVFGSDAREAAEWLSARMVGSVALLGILPAALLWWPRIEARRPAAELLSRVTLGLQCVAIIGAVALVYGRELTSLVRNHMELRHIANPYAIVAASLSYIEHARNDDRPLQPIGGDARHATATTRPEVIVLAVGESARARSFAIDGYKRATTPRLATLPIVNFTQVSSCGTNTATSLPCMFSDLGRRGYDDALARHRENLLDVYRHAGFDVVWLDNNTGSKHVADRTHEINFARTHDAAFCHEDGCWDGILLEPLRETIAKATRDTVIVAHMLGSHGPAYYHRYPPAFARFIPECRSVELQECTPEQIVNSYDNTIAYTDHVLGEMIAALRGEQRVDAALLFLSDHGESTGDHGLYLHGAPYALAPDEQTHVPMLAWFSPSFAVRRGLDTDCLQRSSGMPLSHDNLFHTMLGLAEVSTRAYRRELDAFASCTSGATAQRAQAALVHR